MTKLLNKILAVVWSRAARNVYFILFFVLIDIKQAKDVQQAMAFMAVHFSLIAVFYINNLFLIPRFLDKGKIWQYMLLAILLALFDAVYSCSVWRWIVVHVPSLNDNEMMKQDGSNEKISAQSLKEMLPLAFITSCLYTFCFTAYWYIVDNYRKRKKLRSIEKHRADAELRFLKGQLNPHFLFNTLNNLYGLVITKSDNAGDAILELSRIHRYLSCESNVDTISFEKETEIMNAYIRLELMRVNFPQCFRFEIHADDYYQIPPLLWLPILENVFKHGTRSMNERSRIVFRCVISQHTLSIYSFNTVEPDMGYVTNSGTGVDSLKKRLELLYPKGYELAIANDKTMYTLTLEIPFV